MTVTDTKITHSRLSWYTSGYDDNASSGQSLFQAIIGGKKALDFSRSRDVRQIRCDSRGVYNIKETKLKKYFNWYFKTSYNQRSEPQ